MKFGSKKGQAVMEYLITYGLALFVILVVLGILVAVVIPALKPPEECQFTQPGFSCNQRQHVIVSSTADDSVRVILYLTNDQGSAVNVTGILCTTKPAGNIQKADITSFTAANAKLLASGAGQVFGNGTLVSQQVLCTNDAGTVVTLKPNSNFKGTVAILYKRTDDVQGAPTRMATAVLTGTVQEE
ncbi:Uncharacterised protein [Candidatus Bilamarchaeum dharawalense]|uniref:Uncharacterized protein n=1 Tax=Candidatus Bilamarchaeum dharawalense TaxID=2885759 RepID=A0A5E4LNA8_9ARCH|nr:Uncharacterised protein [Candidatus Bilamarchaeum dharawalense]